MEEKPDEGDQSLPPPQPLKEIPLTEEQKKEREKEEELKRLMKEKKKQKKIQKEKAQAQEKVSPPKMGGPLQGLPELKGRGAGLSGIALASEIDDLRMGGKEILEMEKKLAAKEEPFEEQKEEPKVGGLFSSKAKDLGPSTHVEEESKGPSEAELRKQRLKAQREAMLKKKQETMAQALEFERSGQTENKFANNRLKEFLDLDKSIKPKGEEDNASSEVGFRPKHAPEAGEKKDMASIFGNASKTKAVEKTEQLSKIDEERDKIR